MINAHGIGLSQRIVALDGASDLAFRVSSTSAVRSVSSRLVTCSTPNWAKLSPRTGREYTCWNRDCSRMNGRQDLDDICELQQMKIHVFSALIILTCRCFHAN